MRLPSSRHARAPLPVGLLDGGGALPTYRSVVDGPLAGVPLAPNAGRQLGVAAEAILGAQLTCAQLPLFSAWPGSAASIVFMLPLFQRLSPIAHLLRPAACLLSAAVALPGQVLLAAITAILTPPAALWALLSGGATSGAALGAGGRLVSQLSAPAGSGLFVACAAVMHLAWSAAVTELIFRGGVQRSVARRLAFQTARRASLAAGGGGGGDDDDDGGLEEGFAPIVLVQDWRTGQDATPRRRARLLSSAACGLAALHVGGAPGGAWLPPPPSAAAAFVASFFCYGHVYERRGLAAAVGAHAAHDALVLALHAAARLLGAPRVLILPAAVYAAFACAALRRWRVGRPAASGTAWSDW